MASHESARKKQRQDKARRSRNRGHISRLRTELKRMREVIAKGDSTEARKRLVSTEALIDHSASLGVIHDNAASRTKSRLARQVGALARP